jgi:integrase
MITTTNCDTAHYAVDNGLLAEFALAFSLRLCANAVVRLHPVTSSEVSTKGKNIVPRRRFQRGSLVVKSGQRYGVFREDVLQPNGQFSRKLRWIALGAVSEVSKRSALKALQPYLDRVNQEALRAPRPGITLAEFVEEWRANVAVSLKGSTVRAMESNLRAHILPKLGSLPLTAINAKAAQTFVAYLASGGRSRKTVQNVLLTLSSLLRTAKDWEYACGNFKFSGLTLPREGVRKEARCFTDEELRQMIANAPEPLSTILAVTAVLGLRIGETLALRLCDIDFAKKIVRIRQSVDAATRTVGSVKSTASSADLPMSAELESLLRAHLRTHDGKTELLFSNKRGRPHSANKLRAKQLHPLLVKLGIEKGGFHSIRHGVASSLLADGASPAVVQRQLRHSDARITLGIYGHVVGDQQRHAVQNRSARLVN